jgi:coenzyme F420 biosynthesis associated uncharacterized protein
VPASREDVADLRRVVDGAVAVADGPSRRVTGLGAHLPPAEVRVVGRGEWIADNLASMRWLTDPHAHRLLRRTALPPAASRQAVGAQLGLVFGWLSTRVLGQYEVFLPGGRTPGRLTLVGPNLLSVRRELDRAGSGIRLDDLVLGVVLHELGHRLQFEAVPWLRPHLLDLVETYLSGTRLDPDRVRAGLAGLARKVASGQVELSDVAELVLTPEQAELLGAAQSLMSLLEGHGNVVMDWGAEVLADEGVDPTRVRQALNARREAAGPAKVVGRVLGLGAKAAQYAVGERFVLAVAERHGREAFGRVWQDPAHIPTADELGDPDAWVRRVAPAA